MSKEEKSTSELARRTCFSGLNTGKSNASWYNKIAKGKYSGVHHYPSQDTNPLHRKGRRKQRCGGRSIDRLRPILQDELTNGKYDGESCACWTLNDVPLPKVNWYLSHICFTPPFSISFTSFIFSTACLNFWNCFLYAAIFLALFLFTKIPKNIFVF